MITDQLWSKAGTFAPLKNNTEKGPIMFKNHNKSLNTFAKEGGSLMLLQSKIFSC